MGENTEMTGAGQSATDRIQKEIYHTQADISETVHTIEARLSPANIKRQASLKARRYAFTGMANALDFIQKKPVPTAIAAAGAFWMLVRRKKKRSIRKTASRMEIAGTAAKAFISGAAGKASKESPRTGKSLIWRGLATAFGAAMGTLWYRRKPKQALPKAESRSELSPTVGYPGLGESAVHHR